MTEFFDDDADIVGPGNFTSKWFNHPLWDEAFRCWCSKNWAEENPEVYKGAKEAAAYERDFCGDSNIGATEYILQHLRDLYGEELCLQNRLNRELKEQMQWHATLEKQSDPIPTARREFPMRVAVAIWEDPEEEWLLDSPVHRIGTKRAQQDALDLGLDGDEWAARYIF